MNVYGKLLILPIGRVAHADKGAILQILWILLLKLNPMLSYAI